MKGVTIVNEHIYGERLAKLETSQEMTNSRLKALESDKALLYKMTVLIEQNTRTAEKNSESVIQMGETFNSINTNLTGLNYSQNQLKESFKYVGERVDDIESEIRIIKNNGNINLWDVARKYITWIIGLPMVIAGWYLAKYLGF